MEAARHVPLTQTRRFLYFCCCHSKQGRGAGRGVLSKQTFTSDIESKINHLACFLTKRRKKNLAAVKISKKSCFKTKRCELLKSSGLKARAVHSLWISANPSSWRLTLNCRHFPLLSKHSGDDSLSNPPKPGSNKRIRVL